MDTRWLARRLPPDSLQHLFRPYCSSENYLVLDRLIAVVKEWVLQVTESDRQTFLSRSFILKGDVSCYVRWCRKNFIHHSIMQSRKAVTAESFCCDLEIMLKSWEGCGQQWRTEISRSASGQCSASFFNGHPAKINAIRHQASPSPLYFPDSSLTGYHMFRALDATLRQQQLHNLDHLEATLRKFFDSCHLDFCCRWIVPNRNVGKAVLALMASTSMNRAAYEPNCDILNYDTRFGNYFCKNLVCM